MRTSGEATVHPSSARAGASSSSQNAKKPSWVRADLVDVHPVESGVDVGARRFNDRRGVGPTVKLVGDRLDGDQLSGLVEAWHGKSVPADCSRQTTLGFRLQSAGISVSMRSPLEYLYAPVVSRITVAAARSTVFDVVSDPHTYPEWLVGTERMRSVDTEFPRPGATFDHSVGAGPATIDDSSESVAVQANARLVLRVHAGPFHARVEFDLTDDGAGNTEIRLSEQPIGWFAPLRPLLRPSLQARNSRSLTRLRDLIDARSVNG